MLMENLISTANDKSTANNQNIINDITSLCVLAVIFSDFEIEIFFEINNFSPNFQKTILFQTINFCCDRLKEQENYIGLKFQFWILKTVNKILSIYGELETNPTISKEDLVLSLESLNKVVNQEYFDSSDEKVKCLIIKICYELGIYYYYKGLNDEMENKFNFLLNNINFFSEEFKESKLYFKEETIKKLLLYQKNSVNQMEIEKEDKEVELDFKFDLESNYSNEEFVELKNKSELNNLNLNSYIASSLNIVDYSSLSENLKKSENLITLSMKNENILKESAAFINKFKESISLQLTKNLSKAEENELQNTSKEATYHLILLKLIETMFKGEDRLPKNFLVNLSQTILKNTLTDNLRISSLIHGLILNYPANFKAIYNYFSDFVEFFQNTSTPNKEETIKQVVFISRILSVFNMIINNNNSQDVVIKDELHLNLMNIFFFWIGKTKEQIKTKNNIAYVIVDILKVVDYLHMLKVVFIGVLKFILDKKHLTMGNSNEIFDCIYGSHPSIFKIDNVITKEVSSFKNEKYNKLKIIFRENLKKSYSFDALLIPKYIANLFSLLNKLEKKILFYDPHFTECEILIRKININFFDAIENDLDSEKNNNLINDFIKMFKLKFEDFQLKYFQIDLMNNLSQCHEMYDEFKSLFDKDLLLKFIYILSYSKKHFEAAILLQYLENIDYDLAYKLLKNSLESTTINFDMFQFVWKTVYFEYLSNFFYNKRNEDALKRIKNLFKRISNHQFFKKHQLRKHFKIINFFKFLDNI